MKIKKKILKSLRSSFAELTDEEVFFFIRIKGKKQYFELFYPDSFLSEFKKLTKYNTISEYKKDADVIIKFSHYKISHISTEEYNFIEKTLNRDEVIKRCRGLRSIPVSEARVLILKCSKFFIDFFSSNPTLKVIISGTVDNYVMDIMFKFAEAYSVHCVGITDYFLYPEYKLVTNYGEANNFYAPTNDEVDSIFNQLMEKKESPLAISFTQASQKLIKYYASYYYRYLVRYLYHYKLKGNLGYEYRFAPFIKGFTSVRQLLAFKYFDKYDKNYINKNRNRNIYIPLHWYPEATIDYWTDSPDMALYYENLYKVVRFFNDIQIDVILKEHPAFFSSRELNVYQILKEFPNVTLLSPFVKTQDLLSVIDNVLVWNGSTGVEALMLDKNVYCTTESYYSNNTIPNYTDFGKPKIFSSEEKKEIIRRVLKTSLKV